MSPWGDGASGPMERGVDYTTPGMSDGQRVGASTSPNQWCAWCQAYSVADAQPDDEEYRETYGHYADCPESWKRMYGHDRTREPQDAEFGRCQSISDQGIQCGQDADGHIDRNHYAIPHCDTQWVRRKLEAQAADASTREGEERDNTTRPYSSAAELRERIRATITSCDVLGFDDAADRIVALIDKSMVPVDQGAAVEFDKLLNELIRAAQMVKWYEIKEKLGMGDAEQIEGWTGILNEHRVAIRAAAMQQSTKPHEASNG